MTKEFKLIDGRIWVSNSEIKIKPNRFSKKEFIYQGKRFLIVSVILLIYKIFFKETLNKNETWGNIVNSWNLLSVILFGLLIVFIVFYYKWGNTIQINDIKTIEVDTLTKQVDITLNMNNKRYKILEFDRSDESHSKFIDLLKKRNTSIKIEYN